jgi:hypothetical protein
LNERCAGAIEALAWFENLLDSTGDLGKVRREVKQVKDELLRGVAVDFRQKIVMR